MDEKLAEKRRKLDEARARKQADNSELGAPEDNLPPDAVVHKDGDVTLHGQVVDPTETNAMGQPALSNPEGHTSDVNRDTDTDGDADGDPLTWGHQGIDKGIEPQTTDPRINPSPTNDQAATGEMQTYDPSKLALPAGSPIPGVVAPTQQEGQFVGNASVSGTYTAPHSDQVFQNGDLSEVSPRISARTQAEIQRGKEAVQGRNDEANRVQQRAREVERERRTVVTDADADPDGDKGRKAAEKAAPKKGPAKK